MTEDPSIPYLSFSLFSLVGWLTGSLNQSIYILRGTRVKNQLIVFYEKALKSKTTNTLFCWPAFILLWTQFNSDRQGILTELLPFTGLELDSYSNLYLSLFYLSTRDRATTATRQDPTPAHDKQWG